MAREPKPTEYPRTDAFLKKIKGFKSLAKINNLVYFAKKLEKEVQELNKKNKPDHSHLDKYVQYLKNARGSGGSVTVKAFKEDWEPIGDTVLNQLRSADLIFDYREGLVILQDDAFNAGKA